MRRGRIVWALSPTAPPTGNNRCDMVTGVTIKVAREARPLAGTRAREARPKQRNLCAKRRAPSSESERTISDKETSKTASKSGKFSVGRASRAALRAKSYCSGSVTNAPHISCRLALSPVGTLLVFMLSRQEWRRGFSLHPPSILPQALCLPGLGCRRQLVFSACCVWRDDKYKYDV
jgi:hypothetical protein